MGYPMNAAAPVAGKRPSTVTVSSYLLLLAAALTLVTAVLPLTTMGTMNRVYREAYQGTAAEGTESILVGVTVVSAVINVLFAVALVVLAMLNNRGRNASRIVTWVLGGISLCCTGVSLAGTAASNSFTMPSAGGDMPDATEVQRQLEAALPSWFSPLTITISTVVLLSILAALVLLALPASNAYFRKPPAAGWEPPMPGYSPYPAGATFQNEQQPYLGQQPAHPGQPPYPGQSPHPGQPSYSGGDPGLGGRPAADPPYPGGPQADEPHSGSQPAADPWHPPADGAGGGSTPTDPPPGSPRG